MLGFRLALAAIFFGILVNLFGGYHLDPHSVWSVDAIVLHAFSLFILSGGMVYSWLFWRIRDTTTVKIDDSYKTSAASLLDLDNRKLFSELTELKQTASLITGSVNAAFLLMVFSVTIGLVTGNLMM